MAWITCKDGTELSIVAGPLFNSTPRETLYRDIPHHAYTHVEMAAMPSALAKGVSNWKEYFEPMHNGTLPHGEWVLAYVPSAMVSKIINNCGGATDETRDLLPAGITDWTHYEYLREVQSKPLTEPMLGGLKK